MSLPVAIGDVIADKYRVDRLLGSGGMGVVVAATHLELRTRRAIKVMQPHVVASALCVERFLREARALSELRSTHVARVYDVGRLPNEAPFMVMEYLEGQTLLSRLAEIGPLPVEEAAVHVLHACEALAEAHALGIVHRDLKPDNLFLTQAHDGSPCVKVLDFGVSKLLHDEGPTRTSTGAIVGSPLYMSPEQINAARDIDGRSDIWAMGIILFQLVTGECPFGGSNVLQILAQLANKKPPAPSSLRRDLPPALDAVVLRCLEKDRERRYPDMVALARDLAPLARPDPEPPAALVARIERVHALATKKAAMSTAAEPEAHASFVLRVDRASDLGRTPPPWTRAGIQTTISAEGPTLPSHAFEPTETLAAKPRRTLLRHFAAVTIALGLSVSLGGFFYEMSPGAHTATSPVPAASSFLLPPLPAALPSTGLSASEEAPKEAPNAATAAASVGVVPISSGSAPPSTTGRTVFPQNRSTPRPPPRY
ncbi:serine/threonine-protein kinase [Polyangium sp. y55x31]|uniref:serine/threonine-protein kinase n=1 Tax=Polyangium sp. y55x31 TaxID=3042688 RepID=UPI00248301DC|nr:serine/threonine-protein kinase [Polyangium sp. y55x31]MDI1480933.1 serine/threonine-protein kinase [Polyangium sp. y55x31]